MPLTWSIFLVPKNSFPLPFLAFPTQDLTIAGTETPFYRDAWCFIALKECSVEFDSGDDPGGHTQTYDGVVEGGTVVTASLPSIHPSIHPLASENLLFGVDELGWEEEVSGWGEPFIGEGKDGASEWG
jgi:hypothetical protein